MEDGLDVWPAMLAPSQHWADNENSVPLGQAAAAHILMGLGITVISSHAQRPLLTGHCSQPLRPGTDNRSPEVSGLSGWPPGT